MDDFLGYLPFLFIEILFSFATYKLCVKKGYNKFLGIFIGFFLTLGGLLIIAILPKRIKSDNWKEELKYNESLSNRLFYLAIIFFLTSLVGLYEAIVNEGSLSMFLGLILLGIITLIISVKKDPTPSKLDPDMVKKVYQALGKCYSCQKKVSNWATKCPHCLVDLPTII